MWAYVYGCVCVAVYVWLRMCGCVCVDRYAWRQMLSFSRLFTFNINTDTFPKDTLKDNHQSLHVLLAYVTVFCACIYEYGSKDRPKKT